MLALLQLRRLLLACALAAFRQLRLSSLWLLAGVLTACVQVPLQAPQNGFAASGRVNIRSSSDANTASFTWLATQEKDVLSLATPLGTTLAELTIQYQDGQTVAARLQHGQDVSSADNPEALLEQVAGLQLPVSGMRWWLRGQPVPSGELIRHEVGFTQNGWLIIASDYRGGTLPYRVELSRDDIKVRVLMNEWSAP